MPDFLVADEGQEDKKTLAGIEEDEDVPQSDDVTEGRHEAKDPREAQETRNLEQIT